MFLCEDFRLVGDITQKSVEIIKNKCYKLLWRAEKKITINNYRPPHICWFYCHLKFTQSPSVTAFSNISPFFLRLGWCCSDIPLCHKQVSPTDQDTAPLRWPPDRWTDDFLLQERNTHHPFLLFDLLNFDLHYRCQAGRRGESSAHPPPSITWTLSHCSYHPKQLYCIWELSWLYQTHTHTRTVCTDYCIPNTLCWHTCNACK